MAPKTFSYSGPALPSRLALVSAETLPRAAAAAFRAVESQGFDLAEVARILAPTDPGRVWLAIERAKVLRNVASQGAEYPEFSPILPTVALGSAILALRDETLLSWGSISARAGVSEGKLRAAYRRESGRSERVGLANSVAVRRARVSGEVAASETPGEVAEIETEEVA